MKKNLFYVMASITISIQSCGVKSLHPIYENDQTVYLPELEGGWLLEDEEGYDSEATIVYIGDTSKLSGKINHGYLFSFKDNPQDTVKKEISIHVVEIDDELFCDLYASKDWSRSIQSVMEDNVLPVHTFGKIKVIGDSLYFQSFNRVWLKELFEQNKVRIPHENVDGPNSRITVLTASTKELQKFIAKYHKEEKAFEKPMIFPRKR